MLFVLIHTFLSVQTSNDTFYLLAGNQTKQEQVKNTANLADLADAGIIKQGSKEPLKTSSFDGLKWISFVLCFGGMKKIKILPTSSDLSGCNDTSCIYSQSDIFCENKLTKLLDESDIYNILSDRQISMYENGKFEFSIDSKTLDKYLPVNFSNDKYADLYGKEVMDLLNS